MKYTYYKRNLDRSLFYRSNNKTNTVEYRLIQPLEWSIAVYLDKNDLTLPNFIKLNEIDLILYNIEE